MTKKPIMIDDILYGGVVEFSQGEYDDKPQDADRTRKPELEIFIRGEYWRQPTAVECAALLMSLGLKIDEIEKQIMTSLTDEQIRTATTALHMLLSLRSIK